jgi:hypothetical protein
MRLYLMYPFLICLVSRVSIVSSGADACDNGFVFAVTDRVSWATAWCAGGGLAISIH